LTGTVPFHIIYNDRAKELASKQKDQKQESTGVTKFDYLIGQSEVFAHFLAGEFLSFC
jgi:hypothetical protein